MDLCVDHALKLVEMLIAPRDVIPYTRKTDSLLLSRMRALRLAGTEEALAVAKHSAEGFISVGCVSDYNALFFKNKGFSTNSAMTGVVCLRTHF